MATLKLDLTRPLGSPYWCSEYNTALFCSSGFDEAFGETRLSRCTLEVRAANPRKKGWIKITLSPAGTVRFRSGSRLVSRALLSGPPVLARRAGLIPPGPGPGMQTFWARVTYHKAAREAPRKRSPR